MKIRFVEFLLIPLLIFGYLYFVDLIVTNNIAVPGLTQPQQPSSPGATVVSLGESVSVVAMRPYFGGLIRLPTYTGSVGYIGWMHDLFFNFIIILTISFVLLEIYLTIRGKQSGFGYKPFGGGYNMAGWKSPMQTKSFNWTRVAKAAVAGIIFGLISIIVSGDTVSIPLGLLVAYLEYRLGS